jgi:hypothetical protein
MPVEDSHSDKHENRDTALDNDGYLFLHENLTVTDGIWLDQKIVFDSVTPEWRQFCKTTLQFEPPSFTTNQPTS